MTPRRAYSARLLFSVVIAGALSAAVAVSCGPLPDEGLAAAEVVQEAPDDAAPVVLVVPTADLASSRDEQPAPEDPIDPDAECLEDDDCQDGQFCNGYEVCAANLRCVPGRPIECPAFLPFCDEDMDTCVCTPGSCPAPSTCDGFTCL
jgi:hypothetical protein